MLIETVRRTSSIKRRRGILRRQGSENGAIAIMAAFVLILMIGMFGMALDLSRSYNRKTELQSVADAIALAAASGLDGTRDGVEKAVKNAEDAAVGFNFSYNKGRVSWSSDALFFSTAADGGSKGWVDATTAKANASTIFFARVDTSGLAAKHGKIRNFLMPVLSSSLAMTNVTASAVAGRDLLNVLPLAICANSNTPASGLPSGELVEFGFRRGVSYNLMNLNPGGRSPENFLMNPVAPAGTTGTTMKNKMDVVGPFVCTGRMAVPTLQGGAMTVERGFPIDPLYVQLNSRFGTASPCSSTTAPADPVTKKYDLANITWMKFKPDGLAANSLSSSTDPLLTIAEKPAGATKTAYGPLWSFAKAAKYADYVAYGGKEPAEGYQVFSTTEWGTLYNPGVPEPKSYTSIPYQAAGGSPTYVPHLNTRVLRIPLLRCPVSSDALTTATVVGIGKFFMTVQATSTALYAEFAGVGTEAAMGGDVRLYR